MNANKASQEIKDVLKMLRRDWFDQVELIQLQSKLTSEKYKSLIENGFTEDQALEIIKARGIY